MLDVVGVDPDGEVVGGLEDIILLGAVDAVVGGQHDVEPHHLRQPGVVVLYFIEVVGGESGEGVVRRGENCEVCGCCRGRYGCGGSNLSAVNHAMVTYVRVRWRGSKVVLTTTTVAIKVDEQGVIGLVALFFFISQGKKKSNR